MTKQALGLLVLAAACAPYPQRVHQPVVIPNNSTVQAADAASAAAAVGAEQQMLRNAADSDRKSTV